MPYADWNPGENVGPAFRTFADDVPPTEMPDDATTYELHPGSVLHVPRLLA